MERAAGALLWCYLGEACEALRRASGGYPVGIPWVCRAITGRLGQRYAAAAERQRQLDSIGWPAIQMRSWFTLKRYLCQEDALLADLLGLRCGMPR